MDEFLDEFLIECSENVTQIDGDLLLLETGDREVLKTIFRAIHTLKGSCGMFGFKRLEYLAHCTEDVFEKMRDGHLEPSPLILSKVLQSIDIIRNHLSEIQKNGSEPEGHDVEIINDLLEIMSQKVSSHEATKEIQDTAKSELNSVIATTQIADNSLRVNIDVLDEIMNAIGELVLSRNRLIQLNKTDTDSIFTGPIQHLDRITSGLQEAVMKTRMQPIGNAWARLPRILRDLCSSTDKKIQLVMTGQSTELDRQILQAIGDPLIHCVRNSADHGIEDPETRVNKSKDPQGTISLNAFHQGGKIIIEIKDDGAGINLEAVKSTAIQRGRITREAAEKISSEEILNFIFEPGFSTAEKVTEVSGRGVGMDVVKTNIEKIGGTLNLFTRSNIGTTLTIEIPLTLTIIHALIVKARHDSSQVFAIPQTNIMEVVNFDARVDSLENIHGSYFFKLRQNLLPLIDLGHALGLTHQLPFSFIEDDKNFSIIIVRSGNEYYGLCVHNVSNIHEIVVKPLGKLLREMNIFAGSTIMGDGSVVIVLDVPGIITANITREESQEYFIKDENKEDEAEKNHFLLFSTGKGTTKAVPLGLVSRIEQIEVREIQNINESFIIPYHGKFLRLIACADYVLNRDEEIVPVIIFTDGVQTMGLIVEKIIDVIGEHIIVEEGIKKDGVIGAAIIKGRTVEVIDLYFYLQTAFPDWFKNKSNEKRRNKFKILFVEDSIFFRNLITPIIESAGYKLVVKENGSQALDVLESEKDIDFILSDIEMPVMDGFSLARKVKAHHVWNTIPIIALSSSSSETNKVKAKMAGFDDYLTKFDRDLLLETLRINLEREEIR